MQAERSAESADPTSFAGSQARMLQLPHEMEDRQRVEILTHGFRANY